MANYIKTLKDDNGDTVYPQTLASAVYIDSTTDLSSRLNSVVNATRISGDERPQSSIGAVLQDGEGYTLAPVTWADFIMGELDSSHIDWSGSPASYSTSEVRTGATWIDGKPIYKKTIDFGAEPSANTPKKVSANISNLGKVIKMEGIGYDDNGAFMPLPYTICNSNANYEMCFYGGEIEITRGNISVVMNHIFVTLYYTKSTD